MTTINVAEFCSTIKSVNLNKWMIAYYLRSVWYALDSQIVIYQGILKTNLLSSHFLDKLRDVVIAFWDVEVDIRQSQWHKGKQHSRPWHISYLGSVEDHRKAKNFLDYLSLEIRLLEDRKSELLDRQFLLFLRAMLKDVSDTVHKKAINEMLLPVIDRAITYID